MNISWRLAIGCLGFLLCFIIIILQVYYNDKITARNTLPILTFFAGMIIASPKPQ